MAWALTRIVRKVVDGNSIEFIEGKGGAPTTAIATLCGLAARTDGGATTTWYQTVDYGVTWTAIGPYTSDYGAGGMSTDVIAESTATAGVTVDVLTLVKDGGIDTAGTRTAADALVDVGLTVGHATNAQDVVYGHSVHSTARTGTSSVNAFRAALDSDAADDATVLYRAFRAETDGTDGVHSALSLGAGFDYVVDAASCATGEDVWSLPTNVAVAWRLYDATAALSAMTVVTTTGSMAVNIGARATTTDGVVSGTARRIGGLASASVADSTAINQAAGGYVATDTTYAIPANTLKSGSVLKIHAVVRISTVLNGGATAQAQIRLGGAALITSAESTAGASGTRCTFDSILTFRAAPGAAVEAAGTSLCYWSDTFGSIVTAPIAAGAVPTFATNGALTVDVAAECSAAGDGSGRLVCEQLVVEII
jgi:hypothetical protein